MITTQRELRQLFWQSHPNLSRARIGNGEHRDYPCDTRIAFCDWIDSLARSGEITEALASRATLREGQ